MRGARCGAERACLRLGLVAALLAGLAACGSPPAARTTEVTYGVTGSACKADIVYQDATGVQTTLSNQALPWNIAFPVPKAKVNGFPLFLSATNLCAIGTITVNAEVNGSLFATQTSLAPNGIAQIAVSLF
jgi:hypothetical protein